MGKERRHMVCCCIKSELQVHPQKKKSLTLLPRFMQTSLLMFAKDVWHEIVKTYHQMAATSKDHTRDGTLSSAHMQVGLSCSMHLPMILSCIATSALPIL